MIPDADKKLLPRQPNLSLAEGLRVLQHVMAMDRPLGVSEIARELDIEKTRSHRLLRTLASLGYLKRLEGGVYSTGEAVPILATLAIRSAGFAQNVFPVLESLQAETGMLVTYAVRWNRLVAYLYYSDPGHSKNSAIGGHELFPASLSRLGRVMLARLSNEEIRRLYSGHKIENFPSTKALIAELDIIRARGYLFEGTNDASAKEHDVGVAISLPFLSNAAIAIVGDITASEVPRYLKLLNTAAETIASRSNQL